MKKTIKILSVTLLSIIFCITGSSKLHAQSLITVNISSDDFNALNDPSGAFTVYADATSDPTIFLATLTPSRPDNPGPCAEGMNQTIADNAIAEANECCCTVYIYAMDANCYCKGYAFHPTSCDNPTNPYTGTITALYIP